MVCFFWGVFGIRGFIGVLVVFSMSLSDMMFWYLVVILLSVFFRVGSCFRDWLRIVILVCRVEWMYDFNVWSSICGIYLFSFNFIIGERRYNEVIVDIIFVLVFLFCVKVILFGILNLWMMCFEVLWIECLIGLIMVFLRFWMVLICVRLWFFLFCDFFLRIFFKDRIV